MDGDTSDTLDDDDREQPRIFISTSQFAPEEPPCSEFDENVSAHQGQAQPVTSRPARPPFPTDFQFQPSFSDVVNVYVCRYPDCTCKIGFRTANELSDHQAAVHGLTYKEPLVFSCAKCPATFTRQGFLARHLRTAHCDGDPSIHSNSNPTKDENKAVSYNCASCSQHISDAVAGRAHVCPMNMNPGPSKVIIPARSPINQVRGLPCVSCSVQFPNADAYRNHNCVKLPQIDMNFQEVFFCKYCPRTFSYPANLKRHEMTHMQMQEGLNQPTDSDNPRAPWKRCASNNAYKHGCNYCSATFPDPAKLYRHEYYHKSRHRCPECQVVFSSSMNLRMHKEKEHPDTFEEDRMNNKRGPLDMQQYILGDHLFAGAVGESEMSQNRIGFPPMAGGRMNGFLEHAQLAKSSSIFEPPKSVPGSSQAYRNLDMQMQTPKVELQEGTTWTCRTCNREFGDYATLEAHGGSDSCRLPTKTLNTLLQGSGQLPGPTLSSPHSTTSMSMSLTPKVEIKEESNWTCPTCQREFVDYATLEAHSSLRSCRASNDLLIPELSISQSQGVMPQEASAETAVPISPQVEIKEEGSWRCPKCEFQFETYVSLEVHTRSGSCQDPPPQGSGLPSDLLVSADDGQLPFGCPDCAATFSTGRGLNTHRKSSHGPGRVLQPMATSPKSFFDYGEYDGQAGEGQAGEGLAGEGLEVGRPYACSYCSAKFRMSSHLVRHVLLHKGIKPFACKFCPERFTQVISLQCHERKHTGERPFPCRYCPSKFRLSAHLKRHEKCHETRGETEILLSVRREMEGFNN